MIQVSRPPELPSDVPAIAEVSTRSEAIDQLDFPSTVSALEGLLARPDLDVQRDTRLWLDTRGAPFAFALLDQRASEQQIDGLLWMRVLPERRSDEIGREMIAWGAERLSEVGRERGVATRLASGTLAADAWRLALLKAHGFEPIRHFLRMERPLDAPVEPPALPSGFAARAVVGDEEAEAWTALFNQSFIDHWNHHPLTVDRLRSIWSEPLYRRDLDLVLVADDGALAAFCAAEINPVDPDGAGWIEVLGTRRGYRGKGLGRAALLTGLTALRGAGARVARLIVDAESLTGATRLYESVGFQVSRRTVRLARSPQAPA